jgi:hypothetical protein
MAQWLYFLTNDFLLGNQLTFLLPTMAPQKPEVPMAFTRKITHQCWPQVAPGNPFCPIFRILEPQNTSFKILIIVVPPEGHLKNHKPQKYLNCQIDNNIFPPLNRV